MKALLFSFVLVFMAHPAPAAGIKWDVLEEESHVRFSGIQAGDLAFEGEFTEFTAQLCFDERAIDDAWARLEFDVLSADTGVVERDEILRANEWMNAAQYPTARFETANITRLGPNSYQADGILTLKGTSKPLTFPFTLNLVEESAAGTFTIDRRDFNIGDGAWGETERWVAYAIDISFYLSATTGGEACDEQNR